MDRRKLCNLLKYWAVGAGFSVVYCLAAEEPLKSAKTWQLYQSTSPKTELQLGREVLGKKLFFDVRLSEDNDMSCATCHQPDKGWSDGEKTAIGRAGLRLSRATPGLLNIARLDLLMWDGRARGLNGQALLPLTSEKEMNANLDSLLTELAAIDDYAQSFQELYSDGLTAANISHAIAQFEMTLVSENTAFSAWLNGDSQAMTAQQVKGFELFIDQAKGNCIACHHPPDFTDAGFHNLGLEDVNQPGADLGRYNQRPVAILKGAFKTPGLWDIEKTAPYFHDGSAENLEDVLEYYITGGLHKQNVSPSFKPLDINTQEKQALVAFLRALTSEEQGAEL